MIIQNWTSENVLAEVLNRIPPSPTAYVRFLEMLLEGSGRLNDHSGTALQDWAERINRTVKTRRELFFKNYLAKAPTITAEIKAEEGGWTLPENISREESMPFRRALISARLRVYVDAWLDTGRRPDGSESPSGRDVRTAPEAWQGLLEYMGNAPPRLSLSSTGASELIVVLAEPTAYVGKVRGLFEAMTVEAQRLFFGMMASDWKDRLCKCRYQYCGRYFLHPRPRKCYRRGTYCSRRHAASAAADHSMRHARMSGIETLFEAAAHKLCMWRIENSAWQDDPAIKRRLANELCHVIAQRRIQSYRQEVKVNWVSRHQETIELKRVEFAKA